MASSASLKTYKRVWYDRHRDTVLARAAQRKERLRKYATAEQLAECRPDPRKAFSIVGDDKAVCLECGLVTALVAGPHLKRHGLTDDEYREKWGYNRQTALACLDLQRKHSRSARLAGGVRRMRGKQHPTSERTERLIEARRAAPKRLEYRLNVGDTKRGEAREDLWKQVDGHTITDFRLVEMRLDGKTIDDIASQVGLSRGSVGGRLRLKGYRARWESQLKAQCGHFRLRDFRTCDGQKLLADIARQDGTLLRSTLRHLRSLLRHIQARDPAGILEWPESHPRSGHAWRAGRC
jgi:predicted transcriptional regulator